MQLKKIPRDAVPKALERAKHYRLLNEPNQAESICLDILALEPGHQEALRTLILALSDQLDRRLGERFRRAKELLPQLDSEYARVYYEGILDERRGRAQLERGGPAVGPAAHEWLRRAMDCYDRAAELAEPGNAEALLRWNTCVRLIESHAELRAEETTQELMLE
jgi:hypothetical protein